MQKMLPIEHRANSVGVIGDDGFVRCGLVVDVADNGLLIDFRCSQQKFQLIPFDKVLTSWPIPTRDVAKKTSDLYVKVPVELLVPETASGPWIWVPAEMNVVGHDIPHLWYEAAVVQWRDKDNGTLCTDIVPLERIRRTPTLLHSAVMEMGPESPDLAYRCTKPGELVKASMPLNEKVALLSAEKLENLMKRLSEYLRITLWSRVAIVDLADGRLDYIFKSGAFPYDSQNKMILAHVGNANTYLTELFLSKSSAESCGEVPLEQMSLPAEVLLQVFSQLDTVTQTVLSRVCASWNWMMESPTLASTVVIKDSADFKSDWACYVYAQFFYPAVIYKRLRTGTKHIVVARERSELSTKNVFNVLDMVRYVADHQSAIRLRTLHLSGRNLRLRTNCAKNTLRWDQCTQHDVNVERNPECLKGFVELYGALPCHVLRLTNCTITLHCSISGVSTWEELGPTLSMEVSTANIGLGADFGCTLWNALEAALSVPRAEELVELSQWLAQLSDSQMEDKIVVCKTLCAMQSCDPRPSSHYRGKKWCVDGLQHLQLEKLSRLALHLLLQIQSKSDETSD